MSRNKGRLNARRCVTCDHRFDEHRPRVVDDQTQRWCFDCEAECEFEAPEQEPAAAKCPRSDKVQHATRGDALKAEDAWRKKGVEAYQQPGAYRCECGFWHTGRKPAKKKPKKRR